MSLSLPTFASGSRVRASDLALITAAINALVPVKIIKPSDQNYAVSSTTLQNDTHLLVAGVANTIYEFEFNLIYKESAAQAVDCKVAFTQPASCRLDAVVTAAHIQWPAPSAGNLEAEWAAWQGETGSPTSTRSFGTNTVGFGARVTGTWQVGATAGNLRLQAAQNTSSANTLTIMSGSSLIIRAMP